MTTGPTVTGAAWAGAVTTNSATRIDTSSASRRTLFKRRVDTRQDGLDTLSGTLHILGSQPPEQRLVEAHERLQALALICQPAQSNATTDIPQQRIPDIQESPVAATFDQPAVKTQ